MSWGNNNNSSMKETVKVENFDKFSKPVPENVLGNFVGSIHFYSAIGNLKKVSQHRFLHTNSFESFLSWKYYADNER